MCHLNAPSKLYGVAQSPGYGELRKITPVEGDFKENKYYFFPLHSRVNPGDAVNILTNKRYLGTNENLEKKQLNIIKIFVIVNNVKKIFVIILLILKVILILKLLQLMQKITLFKEIDQRKMQN